MINELKGILRRSRGYLLLLLLLAILLLVTTHAVQKIITDNMRRMGDSLAHSYSVEEFRGSSLNNSEASYFIAFSLSLMDNEPQNKLESIVDQIIDEIQKSQ